MAGSAHLRTGSQLLKFVLSKHMIFKLSKWDFHYIKRNNQQIAKCYKRIFFFFFAVWKLFMWHSQPLVKSLFSVTRLHTLLRNNFLQLVAHSILWKLEAFQEFQHEPPETKASNCICHSTKCRAKGPAKGIHDPDELQSSCQSFWAAASLGCQRMWGLRGKWQSEHFWVHAQVD